MVETIRLEATLDIDGGPLRYVAEVGRKWFDHDRDEAIAWLALRVKSGLLQGLAYYDAHPEELAKE